IYKNPIHPYTNGLLASIPRPTPGVETRLPTIEGVAPSLAERPSACVFSTRCPVAQTICLEQKPVLEEMSPGRPVKCHRWREIAEGTLLLGTAPVDNVVNVPPQEGYVLTVNELRKRFGEESLFDKLTMRQPEFVQAVDGVSLKVRARSTLGLVGE